jgi:deoxyhypusine synthase
MEIKDFRLDQALSPGRVLEQLGAMGFQASELGQALKVVEKMKAEKATLYLGFTANLVASGLRGILAELCRKKFVDVIVTTAGALEHDFIKAYAPYLKGGFDVDDVELHKKNINRIGNIFVPSKRYELFEEKFQAVLQSLYREKKVFSPSELAKRMGEGLEDEGSFLYWSAKNEIPVFCPGITDGAIGLQSFFFKQERKDFGIDVTGDMKLLADLTLNAEKTGAIILGGGISKHHIIGANIVREGLDYAVYFSTAQEFDGSLSGARTREGKSWGKIKEEANAVTVYADATLSFPLLAAALKEKKLL